MKNLGKSFFPPRNGRVILATVLLAGFALASTGAPQATPPPYPLEGKVESILSRPAPRGWAPTGVDESLYADLSEPIVRQAVAWQDASGKIIDPFVHRETSTVTPRFVGALAGLLLQGRCLDLADYGRRALSAAAEDLLTSDRKYIEGAEFYPKELMLGFLALAPTTDAATVARWKHCLGAYDPEKNYEVVLGKRARADLANFVTFGLAGEGMKKMAGMADNSAFVEKYLETQLERFDAFGMYDEPNFPMCYDATPKMNLSLLVRSGYRGPQLAALEEALRRGALSMLLYLSPTGEAPFGGRSNQQNFNEGTIALICENEAARWRRAGDPALAGAFKRAARKAALSVKRWLDLRPVRFNKNEFPVDSQHGRQKTYGYYGAYSLLIASQFGFAGWIAERCIEERPTPAETGGYAVTFDDHFHKVFASCAGYHVEVDTRADLHYDSTGLGRLHKVGIPTETAMSAPVTPTPDFLVSVPPAPRGVAIGPGWVKDGRVQWLADLSKEVAGADFAALAETPDRVAFRIAYRGDFPGRTLTETYELSAGGVTIVSRAGGDPGEILFQVPAIETDGNHRSRIETGADGLRVEYQGHVYRARCVSPAGAEVRLEDFAAPNRNGIYRVAVFRAKGDTITMRLELD